MENLKAANENLVDIRQKKMKGVLPRSIARWVGEGEKITKYFCGLEKRNFVRKQINKIIAKDCSILTQTNAILEETKQTACQMYQDMDNIHMYGPSIYSKEVHSNRFWEDTFKVYELF